MVCSLTAGQKTIVIQNKNKRNDPNRNRNATVDFTGDHPRSTHASIDRQQMTVAVARSDKGKGTGKMARYGARESRPATAGPRGAQVPAQWRHHHVLIDCTRPGLHSLARPWTHSLSPKTRAARECSAVRVGRVHEHVLHSTTLISQYLL